MVKDHSDSEKGNPLLPHRLLLSIKSKGSFICTIPQPLLHQSWSTGWNDKKKKDKKKRTESQKHILNLFFPPDCDTKYNSGRLKLEIY